VMAMRPCRRGRGARRGPVGPALPLPLRMAMRASTRTVPAPLKSQPEASMVHRKQQYTRGMRGVSGRPKGWGGMGADSSERSGEVKDTQPRGVRLPPPPRKEMTSARPPCPPPWISPQRALGPLSENNQSRTPAPSASACRDFRRWVGTGTRVLLVGRTQETHGYPCGHGTRRHGTRPRSACRCPCAWPGGLVRALCPPQYDNNSHRVWLWIMGHAGSEGVDDVPLLSPCISKMPVQTTHVVVPDARLQRGIEGRATVGE
jgi:hypothetical protein